MDCHRLRSKAIYPRNHLISEVLVG